MTPPDIRVSNNFDGFVTLDGEAKRGHSVLLGNPETGDLCWGWWTGEMWAIYCGPKFETVQQLDFEPTHYAEAA